MAGYRMQHPAFVSDLVDLYGNAQGSKAFATGATSTGALVEGVYDLWADQDCYIKIDETANDVSASTGYLLRQNNTITAIVRADHKIGAIISSATGTLYYHKVG